MALFESCEIIPRGHDHLPISHNDLAPPPPPPFFHPLTPSRHSHSAIEVVDLSSYDLCVELDMARCAFLTPTSLLITLRGGEVYALRLHLASAAVGGSGRGRLSLNAPNRVVGQSMRPIGRASPCSVLAVSAICRTDRKAASSGDGGGMGKESELGGKAEGTSTGVVFMGSRVGDSLLVKYAVASAVAEQGSRYTGGTAAAKREPKEEQMESGPSLDGGIVGSRTLASSLVKGTDDGPVTSVSGDRREFGADGRTTRDVGADSRSQEEANAGLAAVGDRGDAGRDDDDDLTKGSNAVRTGAVITTGATPEAMEVDAEGSSEVQRTPAARTVVAADYATETLGVAGTVAGEEDVSTDSSRREATRSVEVNMGVDLVVENPGEVAHTGETPLRITIPDAANSDAAAEKLGEKSAGGVSEGTCVGSGEKLGKERSKAVELSESSLTDSVDMSGEKTAAGDKAPPSPVSPGKCLTRRKSGGGREAPPASPRSKRSTSSSGNQPLSPRKRRGKSDGTDQSPSAAAMQSSRATKGKKGKARRDAAAGDDNAEADKAEEEDTAESAASPVSGTGGESPAQAADASKGGGVGAAQRDRSRTDVARRDRAQEENRTDAGRSEAIGAKLALAADTTRTVKQIDEAAAVKTATPAVKTEATAGYTSVTRLTEPNAEGPTTTDGTGGATTASVSAASDRNEQTVASNSLKECAGGEHTSLEKLMVAPPATEALETVEDAPSATLSARTDTVGNFSEASARVPEAAASHGPIARVCDDGGGIGADEGDQMEVEADDAGSGAAEALEREQEGNGLTTARDRENHHAGGDNDENSGHHGSAENAACGESSIGKRHGSGRGGDEVELPQKKKARVDAASTEDTPAAVEAAPTNIQPSALPGSVGVTEAAGEDEDDDEEEEEAEWVDSLPQSASITAVNKGGKGDQSEPPTPRSRATQSPSPAFAARPEELYQSSSSTSSSAVKPAGGEPVSVAITVNKKQAVITQEELEIAEEEEMLYGARLDGPSGGGLAGAVSGVDGMAGLGSGPGERQIEAVGFRLKVRIFIPESFVGEESDTCYAYPPVLHLPPPPSLLALVPRLASLRRLHQPVDRLRYCCGAMRFAALATAASYFQRPPYVFLVSRRRSVSLSPKSGGGLLVHSGANHGLSSCALGLPCSQA